MSATPDFILRNARLSGKERLQDIAIKGGVILAIEPGIEADCPHENADGRLLFGGFTETHIHLDKAMILSRCPICEGSLGEAVRLTTAAKAGFTAEDVTERASKLLDKAIVNGTTRMRSFVEVDPRVGMRSFEALLACRNDYAWALDLELCAFAQEGTSDEPETLALLDAALRAGASSVGGCPYTDRDPAGHVAAILDLAERHGVPVDFHADFDLNPAGSILPTIAAETRKRGFAGRVTVGHVTKLAAMSADERLRMTELLAEAGIGVTVLPATDLFLAARDASGFAPRGLAPAVEMARAGVSVSLATNNVMNPFTPFGDASLLRMANLYANVAQIATDGDVEQVFGMVAEEASRQMGLTSDLVVGAPADMVLLDAEDRAGAVREIAQPLAGWKNGRMSFRRDRPVLLQP